MPEDGKAREQLLKSLILAEPPKLRAGSIMECRTLEGKGEEMKVKWADGDGASWLPFAIVPFRLINGKHLCEQFKASIDAPKDESPEYRIKAIHGQKCEKPNGEFEYMIEWEGYPDEADWTWEPRVNLGDFDKTTGLLVTEHVALTKWETYLTEEVTKACGDSYEIHLDDKNLHLSADCDDCHKLAANEEEYLKVKNSREERHRQHVVAVAAGLNLSINVASDMSAIGEFVGCRKFGSGLFDSPFSETCRRARRRSVPQAEITLRPYRIFDTKTAAERNPAPRSLERMHEQAKLHLEASTKPSPESNGGVVDHPLFESGNLYVRIGSMVLHVDIGLASKFHCDMLTAAVQTLDDEALLHMGKLSSHSNEAQLEVLSMKVELATAEFEIEKLQRQKVCQEEAEIDLQNEAPPTGDRSPEAIKGRHSLAKHRTVLKGTISEIRDANAKVRILQFTHSGLGASLSLTCTLTFSTAPSFTLALTKPPA